MQTQSNHSLGTFLFKYRGQIPVVLFILAIFFIYNTNYALFTESQTLALKAASILISTLGFIIRFHVIGFSKPGTSGRNRTKQVADALNTTGLYSITRNPLYLGNFMIWLGLVCYCLNAYFILTFLILFFLLYIPIIKAEEAFLTQKFKSQYLDWKNNTPAFLPNLLKYKACKHPFKLNEVLRREYSGFMACVVAFVYAELLMLFFSENLKHFPFHLLYVLVVAAVITFLLRTLKKRGVL